MKQVRCILCDKELAGGWDAIDKKTAKERNIPEQVVIWMHNPNFPQEDIQFPVHKECYDFVKSVTKYKDFDKPTEKDIANPIYPKISNGTITEVKLWQV